MRRCISSCRLLIITKIVHGHVSIIDKNDLFSFATVSYTRGHDLEIVKKHSVVAKFFGQKPAAKMKNNIFFHLLNEKKNGIHSV